MRRKGHRVVGSAAMVAASALLAACSTNTTSAETMTWYINPDAGGQAKVAENCSTDEYTIEVQVLPQNASEQRIQLSRRLAAEDPENDIMSIDPPYTAEFANAGFLATIPDDLQSRLQQQSFQGAVDAATWGGELVVAFRPSPHQRQKGLAQRRGVAVPVEQLGKDVFAEDEVGQHHRRGDQQKTQAARDRVRPIGDDHGRSGERKLERHGT